MSSKLRIMVASMTGSNFLRTVDQELDGSRPPRSSRRSSVQARPATGWCLAAPTALARVRIRAHLAVRPFFRNLERALAKFFGRRRVYRRSDRPYRRCPSSVHTASLSQSSASRSHASWSTGLRALAARSWHSSACFRNLLVASSAIAIYQAIRQCRLCGGRKKSPNSEPEKSSASDPKTAATGRDLPVQQFLSHLERTANSRAPPRVSASVAGRHTTASG